MKERVTTWSRYQEIELDVQNGYITPGDFKDSRNPHILEDDMFIYDCNAIDEDRERLGSKRQLNAYLND